MIIKDEKIIFIHIPKTAGDSIEQLLEKQFKVARIGRHQNYRFFESFVPSLNLSIPRNISEYKIFTIVRNPYARLLSAYNHGSYRSYPFSFHKYLEIVREYHETPEKGSIKRNNKTVMHHIPLEYYKSSCGKRIENTLCQKLAYWIPRELWCPFGSREGNITFLKFEDINQEWNSFKEIIGVCHPMIHANKNPRKGSNLPYQKFYSLENRAIVETIFYEEMEFFGYSFE